MALRRHILGALTLAFAFGNCAFQISYNGSDDVPTCLTGPRWFDPGKPVFAGHGMQLDKESIELNWSLNGTINPSDARVNEDLANFQFVPFNSGDCSKDYTEDQVYFNATEPPYLRVWYTMYYKSGLYRFVDSIYKAFKFPPGICKSCVYVGGIGPIGRIKLPGLQTTDAEMAPPLIVLNETTGELNRYTAVENSDQESEYIKDGLWGEVYPGVKSADVHLLHSTAYGRRDPKHVVYRATDGSLVQYLQAPFTARYSDISNLTITHDGSTTLPGTAPFIFVDVNGDDRDDLVIWKDGKLSVALNVDNVFHIPLSLGKLQDVTLPSQTDSGDHFDPARPFNTIRFANLDNDLQPELLIYNAKTHMWDIYKNQAPARENWRVDSPVYFADLDGDGLDDYVYQGNKGSITFFKNLGGQDLTSIQFGPGQNLTIPEVPFVSQEEYRPKVYWADMNGDKHFDFVLWETRNSILDVYLNNGSSLSIDNKPLKITFGGDSNLTRIPAIDPRVADIDGDGKADLWWQDETDGGLKIGVLLNKGIVWNGTNGTLNFELLEHYMVLSSQGQNAGGWPGDDSVSSDGLVAADINGDGKADLLSFQHSDTVEATWINNLDVANGRYDFTFTSTYSAPTYNMDIQDWHFARLTSNRSDIVLVDPQTGKSYAWPNTCGQSPPPPPKNMTNTQFLSTIQKRNTEAGKKVLSPRAFSQQVNYDRYKELVPRDSSISKLSERIAASISRLLHRLRQL